MGTNKHIDDVQAAIIDLVGAGGVLSILADKGEQGPENEALYLALFTVDRAKAKLDRVLSGLMTEDGPSSRTGSVRLDG